MVLTVARMVWTEIVRKRLFWTTVALTVVFLALYLFAVQRVSASAGSDNPLDDPLDAYLHRAVWLSIGLYMANLIVAYLAIFSAAGTISSEIESGLLLAVLPRPIRRWQVYLGKWLAHTVWSGLYAAGVYWAVVGIVRVRTGLPLDPSALWRGCGVFELIPCVLVSLMVLGSLFLPTLSNGVMGTLLFGIGMIGGFVQRVSAAPTMSKVGFVTSLIIPTNADYYRMFYEALGGSSLPPIGAQMSARFGPFGGGPVPNNAFLVYTGLYIALCVGIGLWRFGQRDL